MKKTFTILVLLAIVAVNTMFAQTPQLFKYQAVLRDASNIIVASTAKTVVIDILQGTATGTSVYEETHSITTTAQGVINLNIGGGSVNSGVFASIPWNTNTYWVKVTVDAVVISSAPLLSVPYALNAKYAESGDYNALSNKPTITNTQWTTTGSNIYYNTGNVGVGTTSPDPSAKLDVSSTAQGMLMPRMTTAQRDAIATPMESLFIYNTTTKCFEAYVNGAWNSVSCPSACTPPASCAASSASGIGCTAFTANWSSSSGASSYFLDVATNSGFTAMVPVYLNLNIGNTTSYDVSGLTAGTTYYYRVRAATACVSGNSNTISLTTIALPAQPSAITGTAAVCQGASGVAYSVTNVSGITYTWTYSGTGLTLASGSGTNAITANFSASATSGTLTVTPANSCGTGTAQTSAITLSGLPAQPTAASHTAAYNQVVWNWNTASGATGYKWGTTNVYANATDMGTATTKTEGLSCNTAYTRYVWAYNATGCFSAFTTLTQTTSACPLAIGDTYQGGKIFYLTGTYPNQHGLIAATSDQSTGIIWAIAAYQNTSVTGTLNTIGSGSANTDKIIAQNGAGTTYAAGLARAYTGGGYSDWYLPSLYELKEIYQAIGSLNAEWEVYYWSSTQASYAEGAYSFYVYNNAIGDNYKYTTRYYVRAIRSF